MTVKEDDQQRHASHETLIRLANSCLRAAARGKIVSPLASDLNEEDFKTIAEILTALAKEIEPRQ